MSCSKSLQARELSREPLLGVGHLLDEFVPAPDEADLADLDERHLFVHRSHSALGQVS
jgi:hypothetical protein